MGQPLPHESSGGAAPDTSSAATHCLHCGLPLGAFHREQDGPFCCSGCRTVYELLHTEGLDRYYDLRRGPGAPVAEEGEDSLAWLDLLLAEQGGDSTPTWQLQLDLQGVHCAACVWLLEELFRRQPAGRRLTINPALGTADMVWDPRQGDLKEYLREARRFGYRFGPPRKQRRRSRGLAIRMGITIAAALNVMLFSLSFYVGLDSAAGSGLYELFGRLSWALTTLVVVVGGWPFFSAAWQGLRRGIVHLDLPIALGILLGYSGTTAAYLQSGPAQAYFDSVAVFTSLMLVGRWLQEWTLQRNRSQLLADGGLADVVTRRWRGDSLDAVPAERIRTGDELWIAPGDLVPVSGVLQRRSASISLDWITGEPVSQLRQPGEQIPAGSFNAGETGLRMTALEDFAGSRLQRLLVGAERESGPTTDRWWQRVSVLYVTAVLTLAAAGAIGWWHIGARRALEVAVAVLVVSCPCALGLGLPLAEQLVQLALRRRGILVRRRRFLSRGRDVRKVVFDKTGTLTRARLSLTEESRRLLADLPARERQVLREMTARSNHPVCRCLQAALAVRSTSEAADSLPPDVDPDTVREITGQGLSWTVAEREYRLGRPGFAGPAVDQQEHVPALTCAVFSLDGQPCASFLFEEDLRPDAREEVAALLCEGYTVMLLSGDQPQRVAAAAARLGLPPEHVIGGMAPEQKAALVAELDDHDTMMVGDGLNDAPALAAAWTAATPGVQHAAMTGRADLYYLGDGISVVRRALAAVRRLHRVQVQTLGLAVVYNLAAVGCSLAGLVTPVAAAILMPLSSVTIVGLVSWRLATRRTAWLS